MMETRGVKDREQEEDHQDDEFFNKKQHRLYGLVLDSRMNDDDEREFPNWKSSPECSQEQRRSIPR